MEIPDLDVITGPVMESTDGLSDLTHFNRELAQYEFFEGSA
jgi:hypothetical protein